MVGHRAQDKLAPVAARSQSQTRKVQQHHAESLHPVEHQANCINPHHFWGGFSFPLHGGGDGDSDPVIHRMLVMRGCGELKRHLSPLTAPAMSHTHLQRCCGLPRCSPACLSQLGGFPQLTAVGLRCIFAAQPCTQVPTALGKVLGKDPAPPGPSPASLVTALGLAGFGGG